MSKVQLPSRSGDAWEGGFVFDKVQDVKAVEARSGLVIAGGANLCMLRPGDETWKMRPPPEDIGPMHAVAVEPRGRRYAVAAQRMFAIFLKGKQGDQILRLKPEGAGVLATHMAWGGVKGPCALWVLNDDGSLLRMRPDLSKLDEMDMEAMIALASDDEGVVAMAAIHGAQQRVYVTHDGEDLTYRAVDPAISPDASVQIAVADTAVALVIDQSHVLLSRSEQEPFARIDLLDAKTEDRGWLVGPVAFQGTTKDAALFCARWEGDVSRVVRVDPSGAAMSILEMGTEDGTDAPDIDALSWDATRQTLWAASPTLGITRSVAPSAKGKKKPLLS